MIRPMRNLCAHGPRFPWFAVGLALALHAPGAFAQEVLYGMSDVDQPGGPDELVQIDRGTGVAVRLHVFSGRPFNFLESLAFDPRENVLWTTNDDVLIRIQLGSYATQVIDEIQVDDIDGLAVQPTTGALFGITYGGNDLVRIDKQDASVTILNSSLEGGSRLEDLAFDSTGRLYVLTSRAIVEVNPSTGVKISRVLLTGASSLEGLVWDAQRGTFLSAADRGSHKDLVTINRTTGVVEFVSGTQHSGFKDIEALAFAPGTPIVPVALQAGEHGRDARGAWLAWEAAEAVEEFVVQRALAAEGPWLEIGRVREAAAHQAGRWRYQARDPEAAAADLAGRTLYYRAGARDADGAWSWVGFELASAPRRTVLHRNAPNPFNPTTRFALSLDAPSRVDLTLYDTRGRVVRRMRTSLGAGSHDLLWDGRDDAGRPLASGVYPYVLAAGGSVLRGEAVLVK